MLYDSTTVLVIILIIAAVYFVITALDLVKRLWLRKTGVIVDAKVANVDSKMRRRSIMQRSKYTFSFEADGNMRSGTYARYDPMGMQSYEHGDIVEIRYAPANPKIIVPSAESTPTAMITHFVRLPLMLVLIAIVLYFMLR